MRGAGEALPDMQVIEIKPMPILQFAWFRHGPPPVRWI
jgi:hypothetical protein